MPTNNIKIFDENKVNMLTDVDYNTNTQRLNGVQSGVASSQLQNKTLYQTSLISYAIAQFMNEMGFDASDSGAVSTFVNNLSSSIKKPADSDVKYVSQSLTDAQKTQARKNIGATPSGFGYGEVQSISFWDDEDGTKLEQGLDSKFAPGSMRDRVFRASFADYPICPESGNGGFADIFADSVNDSNGYPRAITIVFYARNVGAAGPTIATKQKVDGVWHPWEYVNPQMVEGVEYRTTERFFGKPVYRKLVNFGTLPNATLKMVNHNAANADKIGIDMSMSYAGGGGKSLFPLNPNIKKIDISGNTINVETTLDLSSYSAVFCLCYTKTTD